MLGTATVATGDLDSHFRYLSGLLLAIGVGFVSTIPRIETHGDRFRLLSGIVVVGGIGRLLSLPTVGPLSPVMTAALVMELIVTPGLAVWQMRVARAEG
jgi:predicted MFS family arabinose efflux permease